MRSDLIMELNHEFWMISQANLCVISERLNSKEQQHLLAMFPRTVKRSPIFSNKMEMKYDNFKSFHPGLTPIPIHGIIKNINSLTQLKRYIIITI